MRARYLRGVGVLLTATLAVVLTGCAPQDDMQRPGPTKSSSAATAGTDVEVGILDSVTVSVPGAAISGSGTLAVTQYDATPEGWGGWTVTLDGADLVGEATIRFHDVRGEVEYTPAPLVLSAEAGSEDYRVATEVVWDGQDALVTTDHFSNWVTQSWDSVLSWARGRMDAIYSANAVGKQPSCPNEAKARDSGLSVTSSDGARVMWCAGVNDTGQYVMKVTNTRGYAVSVEETPGVVLTNDKTDLNSLLPQLFSAVTDRPSTPGNSVHLIGAGETNEYVVAGAGNQGVMVRPSGGGYVATALMFGASTVARFLPDGKPLDVIYEGMDAAECLAGIQQMVTTDLDNAAEGAKYLNDTIGTVFGCLDDTLKIVLGDDGWLADVIVGGMVWLIAGVQTLLNGLGGTADLVLNPSGYQIIATLPEADECTSIYSPGLIAEMEGGGLALNTPLDGMSMDDYGEMGLIDETLRGILTAHAGDLTCIWMAESLHYGVNTRISELSQSEADAVRGRLESLGYEHENFNGGRRYFTSETTSEGEYGESHYVRGTVWIATTWGGFVAGGYTRDIVETLG